jgi:hypothetical protein
MWTYPPAIREAATGIFLWPAWGLYDAIKGDKFKHINFSHDCVSFESYLILFNLRVSPVFDELLSEVAVPPGLDLSTNLAPQSSLINGRFRHQPGQRPPPSTKLLPIRDQAGVNVSVQHSGDKQGPGKRGGLNRSMQHHLI